MKKLIPNLSKISLTKEQKEILTDFHKEVEGWKKFLESIGFKVATCFSFVSLEDSLTSSIALGGDMAFWGPTPKELVQDNIIITAGGFVCAEQFTANKFWPEIFGDDMPAGIYVDFYHCNRAHVKYSGNHIGEPIFNLELLTNDEYEGTWKQVARKLVRIQRSIAKNLNVGNPSK